MESLNNPIFNFIGERQYADILRDMGFEFEVIIINEDDEEYADYIADEEAFLDKWRPEFPEGFVLIWTYQTEDEGVALAVKPVTEFAKVMLAFGDTEEARAAHDQDREEAKRQWLERVNGKRAVRGLKPLTKSIYG